MFGWVYCLRVDSDMVFVAPGGRIDWSSDRHDLWKEVLLLSIERKCVWIASIDSNISSDYEEYYM